MVVVEWYRVTFSLFPSRLFSLKLLFLKKLALVPSFKRKGNEGSTSRFSELWELTDDSDVLRMAPRRRNAMRLRHRCLFFSFEPQRACVRACAACATCWRSFFFRRRDRKISPIHL